jgi:3'-5' exoribonuclease
MADTYHAQKGPYIREVKPGDRLTGFYLVRYKQLEPFRDRTRGLFLTLVLADRTGSLLARVWEGAPELAETFEQGEVVKVQGDVESYMDRPQLIVARLRRAEPDEYDLRDFRPSTAKNIETMVETVQKTVARVGNSHLNALLRSFFDDAEFMKRFTAAPGARRVHHAYLGGLLEHTVGVAALADAVLALYPEIDSDLLLTGALLHEIGKTREFEWESDIDYTDEGQLVGHVVLGDEMVAAAIARLPDFPADLALRVRHMMVSYHGRYEWGSPRRPQTLEAMALHQIEELEAQINRFRELLANRPEGESWTPYDRLLGRSLYAGRDDLTVEEQTREE